MERIYFRYLGLFRTWLADRQVLLQMRFAEILNHRAIFWSVENPQFHSALFYLISLHKLAYLFRHSQSEPCSISIFFSKKTFSDQDTIGEILNMEKDLLNWSTRVLLACRRLETHTMLGEHGKKKEKNLPLIFSVEKSLILKVLLRKVFSFSR